MLHISVRRVTINGRDCAFKLLWSNQRVLLAPFMQSLWLLFMALI